MEENFQQQVDEKMQLSWNAFQEYRNTTAATRLDFLQAIGDELIALGDQLLETASSETNIPIARLRSERARTILQLNNYGKAMLTGIVSDIRIDTADQDRNPVRPDLRKMSLPIGPVVVFGASNFPFAYSTPGGDTASALAAGCTVIVKGHPAHPKTSQLCADAIIRAAEKTGMPAGVFQHISGTSNDLGAALVQHKYTSAVGFTGSLSGGRALFDLAAQREKPIPVFAEMGSVNPVYILPEKLKTEKNEWAEKLVASITVGVGQFCTKPGLIIAIESEDLHEFLEMLALKSAQVSPEKMLHPGIAKSYIDNRTKALEQDGMDTLYPDIDEEGSPLIATVHASEYLTNKVLHEEVFGPYSLLVRCEDIQQLMEVALSMDGQITSTLIATQEELEKNASLVRMLMESCGRLIHNGVPTGVEVVNAMHHGGPYPATTDSRFTSVGADAIRRFLRPVCFQNFPEHLLPEELKDDNPLGLFRTVNDIITVMPVRK
ncbi:MAG: aldehyde dehydrogenase (NADP(+)) [Flavitalea sp.]